MQVEFRKTGERRYAVVIRRDGLPDLEMNPAPGFDALMPHDLLHFLVEQELEIKNGIYGQIAAGGTAGTFHQISPNRSKNRADSRQRRKTAKRGAKLLKEGIDDCARSERATYVCLYDWLSRSAEDNSKARAAEMKDSVESVLGQMPEDERGKLNGEKLAAIRKRMDELSARWAALKAGESIILEWTVS